jgi:hypothetical protein
VRAAGLLLLSEQLWREHDCFGCVTVERKPQMREQLLAEEYLC